MLGLEFRFNPKIERELYKDYVNKELEQPILNKDIWTREHKLEFHLQRHEIARITSYHVRVKTSDVSNVANN